jgi:DtxR family Mn-dependent transcriptional regulator
MTLPGTEHGDAPVQRSETVDRYLEVIYCISAEGEQVRPSRIADWLNVSPPTVSVAIQRLARDGWVDVARDRSVSLTETGSSAAAGIIRRHRLVERWLTDVLDFDWATADIEAGRLAHAVSDEVLERLDQMMGEPTTCPHGNPIPGRSPAYGDLVPLADLAPGESGRVERISEIAEHEARPLLRNLGEHGVATGTRVTMAENPNPSGFLDIVIRDETVTIATSVARLIWVSPSSAAEA